jgi:site-specific recombinase XerD
MKMTTSDPIERFEAGYQSYHDLSKGRRSDQLRALDSLTRFAQVESPLAVEPEHYVGWLAFLVGNELAASTVKKYGMCVRPFFSWAFGVQLYSAEDLMRIREADFPKGPPRVPRPYSAKELKRLWPALAKAHPLDDGTYLKRWRKGTSQYKRIEHHAQRLQLTCVIRLALDGGLRRQEIFDLSLDDMHYDNEFIVVREGKEGKFREVPYTTAGRMATREWFEFRSELRPKHDRPWLSLTRIGPEGVWLRPMHFRRFAVYLGDLGAPPWHLHRLRHTCATNWLRAGMDIEVLSKMLGHSSLTQTKEYVELVGVDVQRQVTQYEGAFESQVAA